MDTLTHAISGAVIGVATGRRGDAANLRKRALWGALFAAFPDSDIALLLFTDHFTYLNEHRGLTHSVIMLPLWAALLGWIGARFGNARWRDMALLAAAAIAAHILMDLITSYGTRVFAPLYDAPLAFPITFIIDPYFTAILIIGLVAGLWKRRPSFAIAGGLVLTAYLVMQTGLQQRALTLGNEHAAEIGAPSAPVLVFPQPFSPFNWKIVIVDGEVYHRSYVNLIAKQPPDRPGDDAWFVTRVRSAYRPVTTMHWQRTRRWPGNREHFEVAVEAWQQAGLAGFREFALLPYVTSMRGDEREVCVWFADLRFTLHGMRHPFEYAMCHGHDGWRLEFDRSKEMSR